MPLDKLLKGCIIVCFYSENTMNEQEHFTHEANNEEEAEIAQIAALFEAEARVREHRARMHEQGQTPSRTQCAECDEPIPESRQRAVPGVQLCIDCAQLREKRL